MAAIDVLTSATLLYTAEGSASAPTWVVVTNNSGGTVYFDKSDAVTVAEGAALVSGGTVTLPLVYPQRLYGIAGSTLEVRAVGWT